MEVIEMRRIYLAITLALLVGVLSVVLPRLADAQDPRPTGGGGVGGVSCSSAPRDMVCVYGGTFSMGSTIGDADELPVHQVTVSTFLIDRHEVSFGQYMQCVQAQKCGMPRYYPPLKQRRAVDERSKTIPRLPKGRRRKGARPAAGPTAAAAPKVIKVKVATLMVDSKLPAAGITWVDAKNYCEWKNRHLPTEAQWEYAARGRRSNYYAWGGDPPSCERANSNKCGLHPMQVNTLPRGASPCGALHMTGNVWEWTHDWYDAKYYAATTGATDPPGPANSMDPTTNRWKYRYRVLRGGSWSGIPAELRTAYRYRLLPSMYANDIGFRCAKSQVVPTPDVAPPVKAAPGPSLEGASLLPRMLRQFGPHTVASRR
jgi:formylglycine-generating enzyme required for sulfatase activity